MQNNLKIINHTTLSKAWKEYWNITKDVYLNFPEDRLDQITENFYLYLMMDYDFNQNNGYAQLLNFMGNKISWIKLQRKILKVNKMLEDINKDFEE